MCIKNRPPGGGTPSVSGGICGEEQGERVLLEICREVVEAPVPVRHHVHVALLAGVPHRPQDVTGGGAVWRPITTGKAGGQPDLPLDR